MRQGTSRVVPVVVSAGLAMGVFCGLLFGLGTGKRSASAEPPKSNGVKRVDDSFTPESMTNPNVKIPDKNAPKAGSNTGSAVAATTGSGSAAIASAAGSAEPVIKSTKLIVEIKPEAAAATAKVFVDGKPIQGTTTDITPDPGTTKKKVKVLVKASNFKDAEQEIEGESTTLKLEFSKTGRTTSPTAGTEGGTGATAGSGTTATSGGTSGTGGGTTGHTGGNSGSTGTGGNSGNSGSTGAGGNGGSTGTGGNGGGKATGGGKGSGKGKGKGSGGLIDI
jgi:hypothetical protein